MIDLRNGQVMKKAMDDYDIELLNHFVNMRRACDLKMNARLQPSGAHLLTRKVDLRFGKVDPPDIRCAKLPQQNTYPAHAASQVSNPSAGRAE